MIRKNAKWIVYIIILAFAAPFLMRFLGCNNDPSVNNSAAVKPLPSINIPKFSADSAYVFTEKIVAMSPRVVGSAGAVRVKKYIIEQFKKFGADIIEQPFTAKTFDGKTHAATNIIARYNLQATTRVLLSAHWDSRPFADQDTTRKNEPILGADDSGSAVGMLLEMARQLQNTPLSSVGVDIVLFDAEDYGDGSSKAGTEMTWCLGSQYWAKNLHVAGYSAKYGINLDMVGAKNARFEKEGTSLKYASGVVENVWRVGRHLGYTSYFVETTVGELIDDHKVVNEIAHIPTIDIINLHSDGTEKLFANYWHTHHDNMAVIDRETLNAVGQTVLAVLHYENVKAFD